MSFCLFALHHGNWLFLLPVCPRVCCCRTEMETSGKEEKKAMLPLQVGQEVKGFVTIKMIFRCWSYVTVCYKAIITGQGTPLFSSGTLFYFSLSLCSFLKISSAEHNLPSPPLSSSPIPPSVLSALGLCYQMLTAASWPVPLFFIQQLCSYRRFSLLQQFTIRP